MQTVTSRLELMASEVVATIGSGRQILPFTTRAEGLSIDEAYGVTSLVKRQREKYGDVAIGRKIGFTNRNLWQRYNVHAPIWGYMYQSTVHELRTSRSCRVDRFAEPLIEPEIVFGLARAPEPWMDENSLLSCIGWIAHGFEIVQSVYPDWKFSAADTVAANGLHGALFIGQRHQIGAKLVEWHRILAGFQITLSCNGESVAYGRSSNVLSGPVSALGHLVRLLAQDHANPPLRANEIVTTGTLTDAMPVKPGQTWSTSLSGIELDGIDLHFD
jgi:2-oxo-3-hexenedioate decarboxylase